MRPIATSLESGHERRLGNSAGDIESQAHFAGKSMNPEQQNVQADAHAARFKHRPDSKPLDGYTLKRGIGIGGFGEVYFAISDAGKEVALKRIQRNLDVELRGVQNCLNLKHVNLISLWDIRTDSAGDSWVVMEYVPGPSLRDIIEVNENGMPGHQIERWFSPIADGVTYLHDSGIVHRDLKPANIFLDEDDNVIKIGDYGLSKYISGSQGSRQTETVGTFHYMAPEIGKGSYGKGIDIYAMGIVLFEMLTGQVPFHGESCQEIIMKHLTTDPDMREVPFDFREVIRRSLLKDPEQRFASVDELKACLPWSSNGHAGNILNSERFNLKDTVGSTPRGQLDSSTKGKIPDVLERSRSESGILFGPLRDSNSGTQASGESVLYIDSHHKCEIEMATNQALPGAANNGEPIAEAVRVGWDGVTDWWNDTSISTPLKFFCLLVAGIIVVANTEWLLPTVLVVGFVYLLYFGIRNVFLSPMEGELQANKLNRRKQKQIIEKEIRNNLAAQDVLTRATSVTGSYLVAAIVCIALNLLGLAITDSVFAASIDVWALFTWSTVMCVVASWVVISVGKHFETSSADWVLRRLAMMIAGILVGGFGLLLSSYFNIDFVNASRIAFNPLSSSGLVFSGANPMLANVLFFAAVFAMLQWWRQVDPARRTRLSVWSIGLCLLCAALFGHVLNFVPLLSSMMVVTISVACQLSSPWITQEDRVRMLESAGAKP